MDGDDGDGEVERGETALAVDNAFFFDATATTEIYALSLRDALPSSAERRRRQAVGDVRELKSESEDVLRPDWKTHV